MLTESILYQYTCNVCGYILKSKIPITNPKCPSCQDAIKIYKSTESDNVTIDKKLNNFGEF